MYRRHGDKLALVFLACDLLVTAVAWLAAYFVRFAFWEAPDGVPKLEVMVQSLPAVLLVAAAAYRLCGLYEIHRLKRLPRELSVVFKASGLLFLFAVTFLFFRRDLYESRLGLAVFLAVNAAALMLVRRIVWRVVQFLRGRGLNYGRAVIIGAGRTGRRVARAILNHRWTGLEAIGFVDRPGRVGSGIVPRLGDISELDQIIARHDVDHVFIALPLSRYGDLPQVYLALSDAMVDVQLVPDIPNLAGMKLQVVDIENLTFLGLRQSPEYGWPRVAKRATDLIVGAAALLVVSPLMLAMAVAVKCTSQGPVFFRQRRTGLHGRSFQMLKFRSMRADAEAATGPVWAARRDSRCTPIGRFMRRWSLDELPQLFNVLAGDMSLVGPRPERRVFVEKFRKEIPGYAQRHSVKAGITGWAQVNGWRGDSSLRHRIQCDLYYVANWSIWLDLKILWLTIWFGLRHRNAH